MNCPRCGEPVRSADSRFCTVCGASLPRAPAEPAPTAQVPAGGPRCPNHPDQQAAEICSRCGSFACRACLRSGPSETPLCARCFEAARADVWQIPWESRAEIGRFTAWWRTLAATFSDPRRRFADMPPTTGRWWDPLSYVLFSHLPLMIGGVMVGAFLLLFMGAVSDALGANSPELGLRGLVGALGFGALVAIVILVPLFALGRVFVLAGLEHLALLLLGSAKQPFEATLRAHCYSGGVEVLMVVPGCGVYAAELVWLVLRIFGLMGVHRAGGGPCAAAALAPAALCLGSAWLFGFVLPLLAGFSL